MFWDKTNREISKSWETVFTSLVQNSLKVEEKRNTDRRATEAHDELMIRFAFASMQKRMRVNKSFVPIRLGNYF